MASSSPFLERVRTAIRVRHDSIRTEQAYLQWVRRFIVFQAHESGTGINSRHQSPARRVQSRESDREPHHRHHAGQSQREFLERTYARARWGGCHCEPLNAHGVSASAARAGAAAIRAQDLLAIVSLLGLVGRMAATGIGHRYCRARRYRRAES